MNIKVDFENVSLLYNNYPALKNITFSLTSGSTYGLIGRNGSGKTSLLSLLASYSAPNDGSIKINGINPFENPIIMSSVFFLPKISSSSSNRTANDCFQFSAKYRPNFDLNYAKELASRFNLELNRPIIDLSKGMQSALVATLGLASRCPITIFDEVYKSMDAPTREIFYHEISKEQNKYPRIVILSTHLISEMEYLFDHVLVLKRGALIINASYDNTVNLGAWITGHYSEVNCFTKDMKVLSSKQLGIIKSVLVHEKLTDVDYGNASNVGLEVQQVSLQDLLINLTKEDGVNEI